MKTETKPSISIDLNSRINYGQMPLLQLEGRIANSSDRQALKELHNRWLNHRDGKRKYHLAEYIGMFKDKIASQWCGHEPMVLEEA